MKKYETSLCIGRKPKKKEWGRVGGGIPYEKNLVHLT